MRNFNELVGARIRSARQANDVSMKELGKRVGLSEATIQRYEMGKIKTIDINLLRDISQILYTSYEDLVGLNSPAGTNRLTDSHSSEDSRSKIPLLGRIAAGSPILAQENIERYFSLDSSIRADFCLEVQGDSMIDDGIHNGDIVFLRQQQTLENGEVGAVVIGEEATLKRFYRNNGIVSLNAANKAYQPIVLTEGDVRIAGKLVAVLNIL